jgi:hypothetical protein
MQYLTSHSLSVLPGDTIINAPSLPDLSYQNINNGTPRLHLLIKNIMTGKRHVFEIKCLHRRAVVIGKRYHEINTYAYFNLGLH